MSESIYSTNKRGKAAANSKHTSSNVISNESIDMWDFHFNVIDYITHRELIAPNARRLEGLGIDLYSYGKMKFE